ncbi:hypothetical protein HAX54_024560, partial [Datura stramonium]|nr:hypothetical protein [Datura stramonium]
LGLTTIDYSLVRSGERPMNCRFWLILASGTALTPNHIGVSRIETGDSLICRR